MKSIYFRTPQEWRTWLQSNHDKETEVWLIFFKKDIEPSLDYESAVEEALCFGWIRIAKRQETREKRISEAIQLLEKGEKLGLR